MTARMMNKKYTLKSYLGLSPAWFDLRKRAILNDNINIEQWQINMNYLIDRYGTIDSSEQKAFEKWENNFENTNHDTPYPRSYLEENVTPILGNIQEGNLPSALHKNRDRNWFLAAYPDVFEYFFPQFDFANDYDTDMLRIDTHMEKISEDLQRMLHYISKGVTNSTIRLVRMKRFYKHELNQIFTLEYN